MPRESDETLPLVDVTLEVSGESTESRGGRSVKVLATIGSALSVAAVLPVPYLVFKSVYILDGGDAEDSFHEILDNADAMFWLFGPLASLLGTLAVAPFNIYNTYRTVRDFELGSGYSVSVKDMPYYFVRALAFSFGLVNGYNMALAYNDVIQPASIFARITRAMIVANATLFAGLDSRVIFDKFRQETPQDWRYFKRAVAKIRSYFSFNIPAMTAIEQCDDHRQIILYALTDRELHQHRSVLDSENSSELAVGNIVANHPFPTARFLLGDIVGGVAAFGLSAFNSLNTWSYTHKSIGGFLSYTGLSSDNVGAKVITNTATVSSTLVSIFMSFFLIRDLFFRDIAKNVECHDIGKQSAVKLLTLVPALCFALLNVALTMGNDELSPTVKLLVSIAAILGSTTVLRYGIEGGVEEWRGRKNLRREMADFPTKHYRSNAAFFASNAARDVDHPGSEDVRRTFNG